jgi:hypothetical protein
LLLLSCCLVLSLALTRTQTLTLTEKLIGQQEAMNTNEAKKKEVLAVVAQKCRKRFKEKRRAVAREGEKARQDASVATAGQKVRQDSRPDLTKVEQDMTQNEASKR